MKGAEKKQKLTEVLKTCGEVQPGGMESMCDYWETEIASYFKNNIPTPCYDLNVAFSAHLVCLLPRVCAIYYLLICCC